MKGNIYKELFELVRSEGERVIVIDPETEDGLVVVKLSEYKRLRDQGAHIEPQTSDIEPTLAKNVDKNLSFWDTDERVNEATGTKLDNSVNSGRIHERKSANSSDKAEPELIAESVDESAGDEYYFEPSEEIGL